MSNEKNSTWEIELKQVQTKKENLDDMFIESDPFWGVLEGSIFQSTTQATIPINEYEQIENWLEAAALEILTKFGVSNS